MLKNICKGVAKMLKIELSGDEAREYLRNEALKDSQIENLVSELDELARINETLRKENRQLKEKALVQVTVSPAVQEATEMLDDMIEKAEKLKVPNFAKTDKKLKPVQEEKMKNERYTKEQVSNIKARMKKPTTNQDRSLASMIGSLGRSEKSVREKLRKMGIIVRNGMCYYKD